MIFLYTNHIVCFSSFLLLYEYLCKNGENISIFNSFCHFFLFFFNMLKVFLKWSCLEELASAERSQLLLKSSLLKSSFFSPIPFFFKENCQGDTIAVAKKKMTLLFSAFPTSSLVKFRTSVPLCPYTTSWNHRISESKWTLNVPSMVLL